MSLKLCEFFGFDPEDTSNAAQKVRKEQACPFVSGKCIKRFKSGLISGACSAKQTKGDPIIICPNRMYAHDYRVLLDVATSCFGEGARLCKDLSDAKLDGKDVQVFGKRWGKELRLPTRGNRGGYFVDWVLALIDENKNLKEFVAIELQTMDTTGSYENEVKSYYAGNNSVPSKAGINWENVSKRILPQIIYKGNVLRREPLCTKGLFFICPHPVHSRIMERLGGKLSTIHPQPGALTFRWYDLGQGQSNGTPRELEYRGQMTTTIDQVALAFTAPINLPPSGVYEAAIRLQLKNSAPL